MRSMVPSAGSGLSLFGGGQTFYVRQRKELGEIVFGFETRNKYEILDSDKRPVSFCAEQQKGLLGMLLRQVLGHWRDFDLHFFDQSRKEALIAHHPWRVFFQELHVTTPDGRPIGKLRQRWAWFTKRFDVEDANGRLLLEMKSGLFKLWTFPFFRGEQQVAEIKKKWAGALTEMFTDADNFAVSFMDPSLTDDERTLIMAAAIFVDLIYFEKKANR
jgi:uncharacterized protein YxjI